MRAELSRRRAERLQKVGSLAEIVPARLLKSALKEVGVKRSGKRSKIQSGIFGVVWLWWVFIKGVFLQV